MTHSGYWAAPEPLARDVRQEHVEHGAATSATLTPLVLMRALRQAGTRVYEPLHRFRLELPAETLGPCCPSWAGSAASRRRR